MGPRPAAEEADALEEIPGGHPGRREDDVLARGELFGRVDAALVAVTHPRPAGPFLVAPVAEAGLDLAAEAAQRGSSQYPLRRPAEAHHGVDARPGHRAADRR